MSDAILAIPLLILLAMPFVFKRMSRWLGLLVLIALYEGLLAWLTGQTLSQEFWSVSLREPGSWTVRILLLLAGAWLLLLVHLAWKRLRNR